MAGDQQQSLPQEMLELVARRFRALGVPSRLRILNSLMQGPATMTELKESTGLEQSNLSRQVTELEREGCVRRTREGRGVRVEISDPTLRDLCALVCGAIQAGRHPLGPQAADLLEASGDQLS